MVSRIVRSKDDSDEKDNVVKEVPTQLFRKGTTNALRETSRVVARNAIVSFCEGERRFLTIGEVQMYINGRFSDNLSTKSIVALLNTLIRAERIEAKVIDKVKQYRTTKVHARKRTHA